MTKLTTAALAAAFLGGVSLTLGSASAAPLSPSAAVGSSDVTPTWTRMMKKKMRRGTMRRSGTIGMKKGL